MKLDFAFIAPLAFVGNQITDNKPHPHRGKVDPFVVSELPSIVPEIDENARKILDSGAQYQTKLRQGQHGRGIVVQDIEAPTDVVWRTILDFDKYDQRVPQTMESETYQVDELPDGQKRIRVRMKVGWPLVKLTVFFDHLYDLEHNALIWTLDYDRKSDFDDSVGFWYVLPHPDHPETKSRVFYSVEGSMFSWVPGFVVDFMASRALTDATEWVKKFSEADNITNHEGS